MTDDLLRKILEVTVIEIMLRDNRPTETDAERNLGAVNGPYGPPVPLSDTGSQLLSSFRDSITSLHNKSSIHQLNKPGSEGEEMG